MKPDLQPLALLSQVVFVHGYLQLVFQECVFVLYNPVTYSQGSVALHEGQVQSNPDKRREFEHEFMNMSHYAPSDFVEVCMQALRWPAVKQEFERRQRDAIERNDWRAEPVYRHYPEAFDPDWDDAKDFFVEYFGSRGEANSSFKRTPQRRSG